MKSKATSRPLVFLAVVALFFAAAASRHLGARVATDTVQAQTEAWRESETFVLFRLFGVLGGPFPPSRFSNQP